MNILLVHQNHPGQYREIAPRLVADGHRVVFLTQRRDVVAQGYPIVVYEPDHKAKDDAYSYTAIYESAVGTAVGALRACRALANKGFKPDIVVGHAGWGEILFVKEVWPDVPVLGYFEYFFIPKGGLVDYDPEFQSGPEISAKLTARNANNLLNLVQCDYGYTATEWQRDIHPLMFRPKIDVVHEGVRTERLLPDHSDGQAITIGGKAVRRSDEIVTYIARSLEPSRGVHVVLRALPRLQKLRPNARVIVIGGDGVSYGARLPGNQTFRQLLMEQLGATVDWTRVDFVGQVPYGDLVRLLRIARCHIYMTAPFVISWSLLEAMALEKTIVASDVAPVRQFMTHGRTGLLVDFFNPLALADRVAEVLADPDHLRAMGQAARRHIVQNFDFETVCYPQFLALLDRIRPGFLAADKARGVA